ncbi:hypothetical protein [Streptomyces sp. TLI_171]|uniref:hypothetical protein n=1 Tax=Streptomyces sp. TLI_171 TaxID=1938859 RepID=UPI000C186097|nr:hypothetical protein [Streptomyces sp. TLI_171]RKE19002.1 hypothetical protein BX266_2303 [Streptomyces sp. TLI_171]
MTNTNLMRCGRTPLARTGAADRECSWARPELLDGTGGMGLLESIGPWSVVVRSGRRPAMEVYEYGELLDVVVESSLGGARLRGARRGRAGRPGERPVSCAWGRLPPCAVPQAVGFTAGRLRRRSVRADVVRTAGRFWFATVAGEFRWTQVWSVCRCAEHVESGRAA